jgi:DNA uptake protein ComE-like DNA-binding protein
VAARRTSADVPARSGEQRRRALAQANEVRSARATLKKQLAAGTIQLAQILAAPPAVLQTARLRDLLIAVPKIGPVKAARILAHCRIAHSKTLGGLTDRQRRELISLLHR